MQHTKFILQYRCRIVARKDSSISLLCYEEQAIWDSAHAWEVHSASDANEGSTCKQQKKTRAKYFVFIFTLIFIFIMSNEEIEQTSLLKKL